MSSYLDSRTRIPGGDLLFSDVSFRVSGGEHVGLVGANGVGKSTLLKVLAGELSADDGEASLGGIVGYMAQDVGVTDDQRTVRELLLSLAPPAIRRAGERMLDHEAQLAAGDLDAGIQLGTAIADWSALGGYELEGKWDVACRRIVRAAVCRPRRSSRGHAVGRRAQAARARRPVLVRRGRPAPRRARQLPRCAREDRARATDPPLQEDRS